VRKVAGAGNVGDNWTRTSTTLSPVNAGDVVTVSAGTAALPGLTPVGDPNTGLYSPGADQLAISTNGTGRLFVDASGRLGLGISAPSYLAHIYGSNAILAVGDSGGNGTRALIEATNSAIYYGSIYSGASIPVVFSQGGASSGVERMRISPNGKILVGGTLDSGGALLQVFDDRIRIDTAKTPASAIAAGTAGEICWDASYIYVCTATNTWKRSAIATW
jgi:hypothetical protein